MKFKTLTTCFLFTLAISSCIQDEALNSEAAIDDCKGNDVQMADISSETKVITVYVNEGADLSKQELEFTLPEGATIKANEVKDGDTETSYDFSTSPHIRHFTVTSEDGHWSSVYTVGVIILKLPMRFHFENIVESSKIPYDVLFEPIPETSQVLQWASGNPGYELTKEAKTNVDYPTVQTNSGYIGKGVKLETRSTGDFGALSNKEIAAGNLFIGSFDRVNALINPLKSTKFGLQFYKIPKTLKGYYKYKAGSKYTEHGVPIDGKDQCDIYAIMYEADKNSFMLDGSNALTSDKLVLLARLNQKDVIESDHWSEFNLTFESVKGRTIDEEKLKDGKYKFSVIFSSSIDGATFKGAVGSTLYIDEVEIVCE